MASHVLTGFFLTVDWIIADMLAARQDALGHVRYVLKDGLKWLPLYGFYFAQVTFVFALLFQIQHNLMKICPIFFVLWY